MSFIHRLFCTVLTIAFIGSWLVASNKPSTLQANSTKRSASPLTKTKENSLYLHDKIIIKLKDAASLAKGARSFGISGVDRLLKSYSVTSVKPMFSLPMNNTKPVAAGIDRIFVAQYTSPIDAFELAKELSQYDEVEYAEPWFIYPVDNVTTCRPNDTNRSKQWALDKMSADSAYCYASGSDTVVIGIIDTGVQWDHPDLAANIWINQGEYGGGKESNNIDDDGNGKIDDWHGWDFGGADYNNPVEDNNPTATTYNVGHGTHVAGIASAVTNNGVGVSGVGNNCKLMPIKTASDNDTRGDGNAYIIFGFQGIIYAADMGVDVVNCSWGGAGYSQFENNVIQYARSKGTLVVAAAGNSGVEEKHYPAAYDDVMSVAARQPSLDLRATYSTYDGSVDVSAPGGQYYNGSTYDTTRMIYSTFINNTYYSMEGTSMASPHIAGLVGLVKSKFPQMNSFQASEQVRVTADPITNQPTFNYKMGKGRANALKAVTDTTSPALRVVSYRVDDTEAGNGNGLLDPGETVKLYCTFQNFLRPTTSASVTLVSGDNAKLSVVAINNPFAIGVLGTLDTMNNVTAAFQLLVGSSVASNITASVRLGFSDGSSYTDYQWLFFILNPLFATTAPGNVAFSVSNFGSLGYYDYVNDVSYGYGFQYPPGSVSALFHASLVIGNDSNHTSDNAYGNPTVPTAIDWKTAENGVFSFPTDGGADQEIRCAYTDSGNMSSRLGLKVIQKSYGYANAPDNDYVILRFDINNIRTGSTAADTFKNVYAGIFADWDVNNYTYNKVGYDASRQLGYMWDSTGSSYYGVVMLKQQATSFRAIENSAYIWNGFSEADKFKFLSGGFEKTDGTPVNDWSTMIGAGPFIIPPRTYLLLGVAFVAGDNLADLQANADAAILKGNQILAVREIPGTIPEGFQLYQNYPNPFNPGTRITYSIPHRDHVVLKVYDLMGHEVATLINEEQSAGKYEVDFDGSKLSSGMYYYRLISSKYTETKKLMLVK